MTLLLDLFALLTLMPFFQVVGYVLMGNAALEIVLSASEAVTGLEDGWKPVRRPTSRSEGE